MVKLGIHTFVLLLLMVFILNAREKQVKLANTDSMMNQFESTDTSENLEIVNAEIGETVNRVRTSVSGTSETGNRVRISTTGASETGNRVRTTSAVGTSETGNRAVRARASETANRVRASISESANAVRSSTSETENNGEIDVTESRVHVGSGGGYDCRSIISANQCKASNHCYWDVYLDLCKWKNDPPIPGGAPGLSSPRSTTGTVTAPNNLPNSTYRKLICYETL